MQIMSATGPYERTRFCSPVAHCSFVQYVLGEVPQLSGQAKGNTDDNSVNVYCNGPNFHAKVVLNLLGIPNFV